MRRAALAGLGVLLLNSCAAIPPPDAATIMAGRTARIYMVDDEKVCALGGLLHSESNCPDSVEVAPGHHRIAVTSYLARLRAEGSVEVDALPSATYLVKVAITGYEASFSIERQDVPAH